MEDRVSPNFLRNRRCRGVAACHAFVAAWLLLGGFFLAGGAGVAGAATFPVSRGSLNAEAAGFDGQRGMFGQAAPGLAPDLSDLERRLVSGTWDELLRECEQYLQLRLSPAPAVDQDGVNQIIAASAQRQFIRFFNPIAASQADEFQAARGELRWLVSRPTLWVPLALALTEDDDPAGVLRVIGLLRQHHGNRVEQFPLLTTAFAVVWDQPPEMRRSDREIVQHIISLFDFYTAGGRHLRKDISELPWDLAIYLADGRAGVKELRWAVGRYGRRPSGNLGEVYFDVPYDKVGLYFGEWQGIQGHPYTLENLVRHGGVCKDQAYFATHVVLAMGIPAVIAQGKSGRGVGYHCWIGYLGPAGNRTAWDFETARYPEHRFWSAMIIDPQTRREVTDADVALRGLLWHTPAPKRLLSEAVFRASDLVEGEQRVAVLKWSIDQSPGNHPAWLALGDEIGRLPDSQAEIAEMLRTLRQFAVGRYDEFAFEMLIRMTASVEPARRIRLLSGQSSMFNRRPDLAARLRIAQGDALMEMQQLDRAISVWSTVATQNVAQPPLVLEATDRIDARLREAEQLPRLATLYRGIWTRMTVPEVSGYAWTTPWFLVGQKYARILEDVGDHRAAREVQQALDERDSRKDRNQVNVERARTDDQGG